MCLFCLAWQWYHHDPIPHGHIVKQSLSCIVVKINSIHLLGNINYWLHTSMAAYSNGCIFTSRGEKVHTPLFNRSWIYMINSRTLASSLFKSMPLQRDVRQNTMMSCCKPTHTLRILAMLPSVACSYRTHGWGARGPGFEIRIKHHDFSSSSSHLSCILLFFTQKIT